MGKKRDKHELYQLAVQDVEAEIDFVVDSFEEFRGRRAKSLREDFCGTANTACEWVRRSPEHRAMAVDLDKKVLAWGQKNNVGKLSKGQQKRIKLINADVRDSGAKPVDVVLAMNFSYYLFLTRAEMLGYFKSVHRTLKNDGLFFLDAYGGYDAPKEIEERRDCGDFTYIWEQASFNPIDSQMQCYIHFELPDGTLMNRAFSYYWRLWTIPEIREILTAAGFQETWVYWEGTDPKTNEGDGIFSQTEEGDADPGWICYVVAEP
ncbi:MAG: class I SAM-dependent methyltransferase [Xanthomonadales bacterium]|nr:class I SAM-dependent methyltransferase [Xanthomonadales bacterium]